MCILLLPKNVIIKLCSRPDCCFSSLVNIVVIHPSNASLRDVRCVNRHFGIRIGRLYRSAVG